MICGTNKFVGYWLTAEGELPGIFKSCINRPTFPSCYRVMPATRGDIHTWNSPNQSLEREIGSSIASGMSVFALLQNIRWSNSFSLCLSLRVNVGSNFEQMEYVNIQTS